MNHIIKVKNLSIKDKRDNVIVNNISFNIEKGEIFGCVGESGSGKTLTAKALINLLPKNLILEAEEILLSEKNILTMSDSEKKKLIGRTVGYIPQNTVFYLHPMIKIKNQIGDGYMYHTKKSKSEAMEKAESIFYKVGFENPKDILEMYPWQLSGGMRQRVNIAMALMNDPKFIVADEPTTALDSTVQRQVMDLFKSINEEMGISILLISHDLSLIKNYSHSIAILYAGQIVESGHIDTVFENPKHPYTKMMINIIPNLQTDKDKPLQEIPGYVQETGRNKPGCLFKARCSYAMDICTSGVKEFNLNGNHYYKCNLE